MLYLFRNVSNKFIEFLIEKDDEINTNFLSDVFPKVDNKDSDDDSGDDGGMYIYKLEYEN